MLRRKAQDTEILLLLLLQFYLWSKQCCLFLRHLSGIIQGCPLSGSIFAVTLDPILRMMLHALDSVPCNSSGTKGAIIVACADNLLASVAKYQSLALLDQPFQRCQWASGLTLKPSKCKVVHCSKWNKRDANRVKSLIVEQLPCWQKFEIVDKTKYLAFIIGPGASQLDNFKAPLEKFWSRVLAIAATPFSARANAIAIQRDATPVLSYIAQLVEPPRELLALQKPFTCTVLKLRSVRSGMQLTR